MAKLATLVTRTRTETSDDNACIDLFLGGGCFNLETQTTIIPPIALIFCCRRDTRERNRRLSMSVSTAIYVIFIRYVIVCLTYGRACFSDKRDNTRLKNKNARPWVRQFFLFCFSPQILTMLSKCCTLVLSRYAFFHALRLSVSRHVFLRSCFWRVKNGQTPGRSKTGGRRRRAFPWRRCHHDGEEPRGGNAGSVYLFFFLTARPRLMFAVCCFRGLLQASEV